MDNITISTEYLARLTGLTKDDFLGRVKKEDSDELNSDYETTIESLIGDKIAAVSEEQRNRGIKTKAKAIERPLKALFEKFEISNDRVEDSIQELTEKLANQSDGNGSKDGSNLTIDEIKNLPQVQSWFQSEIKGLQDQNAKLQNSLSQKDSEIHEIKVGSKARDTALEYLTSANAVGANPESVRMYLTALGTKNLSLSEEGTILVLDGEGNPMKDNLHNNISFKDHVIENWKFGFSEVPNGTGSPNYKKGGSGSDAKLVFRDKKHYEQSLAQAKTQEEKAKIINAFADQMSEADG